MITKFKKRKINPLLMEIFLVSVGLHVLALFILGGITIVRYVIPDDAQFEEPPAVQEEEPPQEMKAQIRPQAAPSPDQAMQSLRMKQVGNIAVAAVNVNLPGMEQSFTVSAGLGNIGGGSLLGGTRGNIGLGVSDVSVFGLKTRAERILFVIDANRRMVIDKKGGLHSYRVIKDEITDMVGNLSPGTLFNVALYDYNKLLFFKPRLVPAGGEIHQELVQWIAPINANANNVGLENNPRASTMPLPTQMERDSHQIIHRALQGYDRYGGNLTGYLTQLALEQSIDAVFYVSGYHRGFERVRRNPTERENEIWKNHTSSERYQRQLMEHNQEKPLMEQRVKEELARVNEERKRKGLPPRVLSDRFGVYTNANELGLQWKIEHPGWQPEYWIEEREVERYFSDLVNQLYRSSGGKPPSLNVVLFLAGDEELRPEWERSLENYVRTFGGRKRVIRGLDEIRSARSASETRN